MPTIAFFYGIAIRMYLKDHLPPHFHAFYGDDEAQVAIETGAGEDRVTVKFRQDTDRKGK